MYAGVMLTLDADFLRSFLAISETGSYGAAAHRVNKTQSTVSAQMKRLEEMLGVSLFSKSGRRNLLTPEGLRLLEYAKSIVRLNEETVNAFLTPRPGGTVKLGICDDYAQAFLLPALSRFARRFPQVEVEILTTDSRSLRNRPDIDSFDAIIVSTKSGIEGVELLRMDQLYWIGSEAHDVQFQPRLPLALWSDGCAWRDMALAALAGAGRDYRIMHTTSNAPLLRAVVQNGLAVTIGPKWYLAPGLVELPELNRTCPLGEDGLGVKVLNPDLSEPLATFIDYVRTYFRGGGQFSV